MKQEKKIRIGSVLKGYQVFLVSLSALLLICAVIVFFFDKRAALVVGIAFALAIIGSWLYVMLQKKHLSEHLIKFARDYESMENKMIDNFPIPYAIMDRNGSIFLYNKRFAEFYDKAPEDGTISDIFREIDETTLEFKGSWMDISIEYEKRHYKLYITKLGLGGRFSDREIVDFAEDGKYVMAIYIIDETEIVNMNHEMFASQAIVGSVVIDNYEEIREQIDPVKGSLVTALIDKEVSDYFTQLGGIVRKLEKDKYFVLFERRHLTGLQRNKFDMLDKIRAIDSGIDIPVTVSMGVGVGEIYQKSQEYSKQALELAFSRGGDQVVVKEGERIFFYGGKTKSIEKSTRVKARTTARNLRDALVKKKRVVIMGHKISDPDCFGASIGIFAAARAIGQEAHIVLNEMNNSVRPILDDFLASSDYEAETFISVKDAEKFVDEDTVLVIVDVNRPEIFECPQLVHRTKTIVMIDHHLQSGDKVENVVLSYVEPTASSASEMITELLQYYPVEMEISKLEAEALYAGILIDTDYFTKNTGVRTFEAAARLRKYGVDVGRINEIFSDSLEDFKLKAETIKTAESFAPGFVMAVSPSKGVENPTIVAAQVANELLEVNGIKASFVMTDMDGKIYISARSKSNVNVQLVMERMGGGGHMNLAGAQLERTSVEDAKRKLEQTIRKMMEEGIIQ